jgi:zinc protease
MKPLLCPAWASRSLLAAALSLAATLPVLAQPTAPQPKPTPKSTSKPAVKPTSKPVVKPSAARPVVRDTGPWKPAPLFPASSLQLKTLPSGVRVLTRATSGTGLVCVQVWARAGSRYESSSESGAAHLVEALALRASRGLPRLPGALNGGAADAIQALGGQVSSLTSRDSTYYSATVAAQYLPQALAALSDAVLRPELTDAAVEEAKSDVLAQQQGRESNPLIAVSDLAYRAAFARHPYAKPAGGASLNVEVIAPGRVRAYHRKMYVGKSLSVVIVGDLRPDLAHTLAARAFATASPAAPPKIAIAPEVAPRAFSSVQRRRPINRSALALAFGAPPVSKPDDVVAMDVLLALFREGSRATLRRLLLSPRNTPEGAPAPAPEEDGAPVGEPSLALDYDVDFLTQRDPGLFLVTMALEPGDKNEATNTVLREVERVQSGGVSAEELARAKNLLAQQYLAQSESVSGQASSLGFYDMIATYEFATQYLPLIERVSGAALQRVAKTYLSRSRYLQVSIEPLPTERQPGRSAPTITARRFDALDADTVR